MTFRTLTILMLAALCGCRESHNHESGLNHMTRDGRLSPMLSNLGNYHRPITTSSPEAQRYFDQGLILVYGFNHAEAVRSFREASRLDPKCGMAYWGEALALAPNINDPAIGPDREKQGHAAIRKALQNKAGLKPVEVALIDALAQRFSSDEKPDRARLNAAYAAAMKPVAARFPHDPDVGTLYADAVMNTMPWDYWTKDGKAKPGVDEAVAALQRAIAASPDHPGAHHIYIHAVEASADPDRAVPSADKLGKLVPGAGHLVHMPAHIYIRVGRYADAVDSNIKAVAADEDYITQCRAQGIYPATYYPHNVHFLFAALSMEGRAKDSIDAARKVASNHSHGDAQQPAFSYLLKATPLMAMVRFGKWDEILAEPDPGPAMKFVQVARHYARGLAFVRRNDLKSADAELAKLRTVAADPTLVEMKVLEVNSLGVIGKIPVHTLAAEIAAARKNTAAAVEEARKAVEVEDHLLYSEPPDWPLPPRQTLGAILLEAGRARDAEKVFREDLTRHRDNGWSLRGLSAALRAQGKSTEAAEVDQRFRKAWSRSDTPITTSRL